MSESRWRARSREAIGRVLAELPPGLSDHERRKAVRAAYPFGSREHHPYKVWLDEVRKTFKGLGRVEPVSARPVRFTLDPATLWLRVRCEWCGRKGPNGCMLCAAADRAVAGVVADPLFRSMRGAALGGDPVSRAALLDWLKEHGYEGGEL